MAPRGQQEIEIVLEKLDPAMHGEQGAAEMLSQVGHGTTWVFATDDCRGEYETLRARGVTFQRAPTDQPYGIEAVFEDLYGNSFSLLQPAASHLSRLNEGDPGEMR